MRIEILLDGLVQGIGLKNVASPVLCIIDIDGLHDWVECNGIYEIRGLLIHPLNEPSIQEALKLVAKTKLDQVFLIDCFAEFGKDRPALNL
jgi:hypothetical protein